jgi:hypothetical protein
LLLATLSDWPWLKMVVQQALIKKKNIYKKGQHV